MTNDRQHEQSVFEHSERVVVREFRFAGQHRARPRRELSATLTIGDRQVSSTLDIDPTLNEPAVAYYRRQLESVLLMRAEADQVRRMEAVRSS